MSTPSLEQLSWSISELPDCLAALTFRSDLHRGKLETNAFSPFFPDQDLNSRIEGQARRFGCEAEQIETSLRNLELGLRRTHPALLQISETSILAVHSTRGNSCRVLLPDGSLKRLKINDLCAAVWQGIGPSERESCEALLNGCNVRGSHRRKMLQLLLYEQFGHRLFNGLWRLAPPVGITPLRWIQQADAMRVSARLIGAHAGQYLFWLASWAVLGRMSFEGRMDRGWLMGWALLLLTLIPFRLATTFLQGRLAIGIGAILKERLLAGALKLRPEEVRQFGTGTFLGQALEAEAVETLALGGGIAALLACVELLFSGFVLGRLAVLLVAWCGVASWAGWRFLRRYRAWTDTRMKLTQDLIENMVGHRTRLAQQPEEDWHRLEDENLAEYIARSREVDHIGAWLINCIARGWLLTGLLALAPGVVSRSSSTMDTAVALSGVLLAFTAFRRLTSSFSEIAAAFVAFGRIAHLFWAAARVEDTGAALGQNLTAVAKRKVIEADQLTFRYPRTGRTTLKGCSLSIWKGERVLLEGPSGGGKSTFASLLSGMRQTNAGLVLADGIDLKSLGGRRWRERVVSAPQFHENYIFTESLAFNLLMGRKWPPGPEDFAAAESICRELGLGELLDRMPSGLLQMVGEGGWQLSHGERSRVYIARALLQRAELVILDESFGALDPENLQKAMECTLHHSDTLLVIAHP